MQVVGERLGPVLGRVHGRVGAYVALLPAIWRPLGVVALERGGVVLALIAEERAAAFPALLAGGEHGPVEVAHLVPEMTEQRPIGLAELLAHALAVRVVGLGEIQGDDAVRVPVVTGSVALESRSKLTPSMGRPSSPSSNRSRRLAASALRSAAMPSTSLSAGRVRVSPQLKQSSPGAPACQLHAAVSKFAQRGPSRARALARASGSRARFHS